MDPPVSLRVSNQKAYVWDVDDIATLRTKHHICGILTGTLPHLAQQNVFLGVPLVLMPEEVVLLVENELAVIIDDPNAHPDANITHLRRWNVERMQSIKQQIALGEAKGAKESTASGRAMTEAAIQKRREREEKRAQEIAGATTDSAAFIDGPASLFPPPPMSEQMPRSVTPTTSTHGSTHMYAYNVTIPASSSDLPWYFSSPSAIYNTVASAKEAGVWTFPETLQERAKCRVFRRLWELGFFMGGGIKFGGDYLVYPGDPLRYHSHFAASVIESPTSALRPMEVVAHGRLGTGTKKAHLLCGWDDEKQEVSYLSIEWSGFG